MKENEQASLSIRKIALSCIILIFLLGVGVRATTESLNTVKIVLSDNYQIEVITTKTVVSDILEEKHIIVLPTENVFPSLDAEISGENATITITSASDANAVITLAEESENVTMEQLLANYSPLVEKIDIISEEISYKVVDKSGNEINKEDTSKKYRTTQNGAVGEKQTTYKVKYRNDIEIERVLMSEDVVKEPVNEVVSEVTTTRSSSGYRTSMPSVFGTNLASLVEGIEPQVKTMNTSAYTASTCDKSESSPSYGITASGARVSAWYTVAAGSGYPMGTIIYIPYFASQPNGGWFVVQDRGGAISNNRLDIYMNTYGECVKFGRRSLECYVYVR